MSFPDCTFAGREVDATRRFCRLDNCGNLVQLDQCLACPYSGPVELELFPKCSPPYRDPSQEIACLHRGDIIRTVDCELCGTVGKTAAIYKCDLHGECSWGQWTNKRPAPTVCAACPDLTEPVLNLLSPLTDQPINLIVHQDYDSELWYKVRDELLAPIMSRVTGKRILIRSNNIEDDEDRQLFTDQMYPMQWEGFRYSIRDILKCNQNGITIHLQPPVAFDAIYATRWQELGYKELLNLDKVIQSLQRNIVTGVFRRNLPSAESGVLWYYAGGMFAFRTREISQNDWTLSNYPTDTQSIEGWPARLVPYAFAGCLNYDGVGDLTQPDGWMELVSRTL